MAPTKPTAAEIELILAEGMLAAPDLSLPDLLTHLRPKLGKSVTLTQARAAMGKILYKATTPSSYLAASGTKSAPTPLSSKPTATPKPKPTKTTSRSSEKNKENDWKNVRQPGKNASPAQIEASIQKFQDAPKRDAWIQNYEMMAMASVIGGRDWKEAYPLLTNERVEDEKYVYEEMYWINVGKTDPLFDRMKLEATIGSKEAVWYMWKSFWTAAKEQGGDKYCSEKTIARQLEREFGTNPIEMEAKINDTTTPEAIRFATLIASLL